MEHTKNFANLAEILSAKFPDLDEFYLYIHILGYVSGFDQPWFFASSHDSVVAPNIVFDKDTLQKIAESFPVSVNQLSEKEKKICVNNFSKSVCSLKGALKTHRKTLRNFSMICY